MASIDEKRASHEDAASSRNQYIAAIIMSSLSFIHGCATGWVSPVLATLSDAKETPLDEPLTLSQASLVGSLMCLGAVVTTPLFAWTVERFGRRPTALLAGTPYILCWLLKLVAPSVEYLLAARFVSGCGGAGVFLVTATYCVEVATPKTRGLLGSLMIFGLNLGIVTMYAMGALLAYRTVLATMLALPLVYLALMWRMPETPAFLARNRRDKEAMEAIAWLRNVSIDDPVVRNELAALKFDIKLTRTASPTEEIRDEKTPKASSWRYLFLARPTFNAFMACIGLFTSQSFLGIFAVVTFANQIFEAANSTLSANVNSIIVGCLQFFGSVMASSLIERAGRKALLLFSCAVNSLSLFAIATFFYLKHNGHDVSNIGWVPVIGLSLMVSTFAMGIGPIPYVVASEVLPVQARGLGIAISSIWVWLAAFLLGQFFNFFVKSYGMHVVFWFFSFSGVCGILVTLFCFPETKGMPFENIIAFYGGGRVSSVNAEQLL